MHLLLDVQGRDVHHQVVQVLFVLAPPDQLRVQVAVAPLVGRAQGADSCSSRTIDWYSAVGMLVRVSCSWRSVSTDLPAVLRVPLGLVMVIPLPLRV